MKIKFDYITQFTLGVFALLAIYVFWFTTGTATNLLKGDDWRFLTIFYKKWSDGTFQFRDWFSDRHPIAWHSLGYILNAELFSLQRIYVAWLGLLVKFATGLLILWKLFRVEVPVRSRLLALLFPLYIVLIFFGMNEVAEYIWPLLTHESSMTFFCGLVSLFVLDALLHDGKSRRLKLVMLAALSIVSLLLMGTLIKLFFMATIIALTVAAIVERKFTNKIGQPIMIIGMALAIHSLFIASFNFPQGNSYPITLSSILELVTNGIGNLIIVTFGLAAGISSRIVLHYPSALLNVFAAGCVLLVAYSIFVYYQDRMWKFSIIPVVLVLYMLLSFLGAIVYRSDEIAPDSWPLYIPRYFSTYHMGWVGVIWIYYYKFRTLSRRVSVLAVATVLLLGISLLLLGAVNAWRSKPYIVEANNRAEIAVCKFANGDLSAEADIPMSVRGHFFSREGVQLLKEKQLNIFSKDAFSHQCKEL